MTTLSKAEISYIRSSLLSDPPLRADGRSPDDFRLIALETGVAPLANGSARVSIGRAGQGRDRLAEGGNGGTEVVAAVKLEVDGIGEGQEGGNVICSVSCSPAAYPLHSSPALDDLQSDLNSLLASVLSHPSLRPKNLVIVPGKKAWVLRLDAIVFSDAGNVVDCLMMACRAALWDTRVPRTKGVEYRVSPGKQISGQPDPRRPDRDDDARMDTDTDTDAVGQERGGGRPTSLLGTRETGSVADFELTDYWDDGEVLEARDAWPVCVTLNMVCLSVCVVGGQLLAGQVGRLLIRPRVIAARHAFP
ncbi:hypothetical protein SCLCIDRAFT_1214388 [Scleroderma citrinum Foug A]|uniref:Ribosomal RNA-processing protein 42 n=1 Tax=Scleroderma citrinum Foug A TaxID=1036808 RepID=A0A0C2ZP23_9AGAM|nr:hypothetical protein SCLCIDRAFT_1214388 [Scleroderma citrinum Foug A]